MEIKPIPAFPGYKACDNGDIIGPKGKTLKPGLNNQGYLMVGIYQKDHSVHRLIAHTFLELDLYDYHIEVDHKNDIKTDCQVTNLQLLTRSENQLKRWNINFKDDTSTHKKCRKCGKIKLRNEFNVRNNTVRDGLRSQCKDCSKKKNHIYYLKIKEKRNDNPLS